jgi:hypothetical protein
MFSKMGFSKTHVIILFVCLLTLIVTVRMYFDAGKVNWQLDKRASSLTYAVYEEHKTGGLISGLSGLSSSDEALLTLAQVIQQRNNISRLLNLRQQKLGQLECEVLISNMYSTYLFRCLNVKWYFLFIILAFIVYTVK